MKYLIIIFFLTGCATAPRPWTSEEKVMLGASLLTAAANMVTTLNGVHNGDSETNPVMGSDPSDGMVISVMAITEMATIVLAHYWEGLRIWILGVKTGINTGLAWHDTRTK